MATKRLASGTAVATPPKAPERTPPTGKDQSSPNLPLPGTREYREIEEKLWRGKISYDDYLKRVRGG